MKPTKSKSESVCDICNGRKFIPCDFLDGIETQTTRPGEIVKECPKCSQQMKSLLNELLDETYNGHEEGCLHCAHINERIDHIIKGDDKVTLFLVDTEGDYVGLYSSRERAEKAADRYVKGWREDHPDADMYSPPLIVEMSLSF
jgi:C4-type Zn-finger protein